jgi:hypothetical protein
MSRGLRLPTSAIIALLTLVSAAAAADGFEQIGLTVTSVETRGTETEYTIGDDEGLVLSVVTSGEITNTQIQEISKLREKFYSWRHLSMESMSVVFYPNETEIVIMPSSFHYGDVELAEYLPSGLVFFDNTRMEYGFRVRADKRYPRLSGVFTTEEGLAEAILDAIEVSAKSEKTDQATVQSQQSAALPHGAPAATPSQTESNSLREDLQRLRVQSAKLGERLDAVEKRNEELEDAVARLRNAVLVLHNMGIFGNIDPVHRQGIERIIELKAENPDLPQEEAAAILHQENIPMTKHEIFLVYCVYFNEFK